LTAFLLAYILTQRYTTNPGSDAASAVSGPGGMEDTVVQTLRDHERPGADDLLLAVGAAETAGQDTGLDEFAQSDLGHYRMLIAADLYKLRGHAEELPHSPRLAAIHSALAPIIARSPSSLIMQGTSVTLMPTRQFREEVDRVLACWADALWLTIDWPARDRLSHLGPDLMRLHVHLDDLHLIILGPRPLPEGAMPA